MGRFADRKPNGVDSLLPRIRKVPIVIDTEDSYSPIFVKDEFIKQSGLQPDPPRYRTFTVEIVACAQDGEPTLVSECGTCSRFVRRMGDRVICGEGGIRG